MNRLFVERCVAGAGILLCAALGYLHHASAAADWNRPTVARLRLRGAADGAQAKYLLVYSWNLRALSIVRLSEKDPDPALDGVRVLHARAELPARFGPAQSPEAVKAWIDSWPRDAGFLRRLPGLASAARRTSSGLGRYESIALALEAYRLRSDDVRLYWLPAPPDDSRVLASLLGPPAAEPYAPLANRSPAVTVQVLNASGSGGVALLATKVLRSNKADVVDFGNAPSISEHTQVIDRTGDFQAARLVRDALGCRQAYVVSRIEPTPRAAVTALIGRDYASCLALQAGGQAD
ncbi:MAG: LytR C-terminal domain-containing protein [Elusimicrobia bacterium]|nr:LytR C-terminal domain-containing protein [Elusimicrobiota bacterium]